MPASKAYRAEARRAGDWWSIRIAEMPGLHAQSRRLAGVEAAARAAIALARRVPEAEVRVTVGVDLPGELADLVERAAQTRADAGAAVRAASGASRAAADALAAAGLGVRDIGAVLGISHQRVAQLVAGRPRRGDEQDRPAPDLPSGGRRRP